MTSVATRAVGMLAPAFFVVSFVAQGFRPGYDPTSQFVSELAIGPNGWVQALTFLVTGAGFVAFALLLRGRASRLGTACFAVIGVGLAASAFFVTDPSAMFDQTTPHGIVHGVIGAVVFTLFPVTCFVFVRQLRRAGHVPFAWMTVATGILLVAGIGVLKYSQLPEGALFDVKGVVQRVVLVVFLGWSAGVAVVVTRRLGLMRRVPDGEVTGCRSIWQA